VTYDPKTHPRLNQTNRDQATVDEDTHSLQEVGVEVPVGVLIGIRPYTPLCLKVIARARVSDS
jgi:hypothetical protein